MTPSRQLFKRGLLMVDAGILLIGWYTWCWDDRRVLHGSDQIIGAWKNLTMGHDFGTLLLTVTAMGLITTGLLRCADAFYWQDEDSTKQSNPAKQADRATPDR